MPLPILPKLNKDHHGFYTVGDLRTYSKLEAIELSVRLRKPVTWNYNRDVFEKIDWTQEPPGSLEFYYRERALQLRERYDYIVLFYSGGSDSHNMLMSFVKNNIFVNEIVQWHQLEAFRGDKCSSPNLEQFVTSIPITHALIENNPVYQHTVHRLIDFTKHKSEIFGDQKLLDQWWYLNNDYQTPHAYAISEMKNRYPAYKQLIDSGKSLCFVYGVDKPNLSVGQDNKLYCDFTDTSLSSFVGVDRKIANQSWDHDEMFYWTPDLPELAVKQVHVIKRYIDQFADCHTDNYLVMRGDQMHGDQYGQFADPVNLPYFVFYHHNQPYTMMRNGVRKLVYPHWNPAHIVRSVPKSRIFSATDEAFISTHTPFEASQRKYIKMLISTRQWMKKNAQDYWFEYQYNPKIAPFKAGFKTFYNSYCLERKST